MRFGLSISTVIFAIIGAAAGAAPADRGGAFTDLGVVAPASFSRGMVAAVDAKGNDQVVTWLMDHRGGYACLMIDARTGATQQFPMPFPPPGATADCPFASIFSSRKRFYTYFHRQLIEFDPAKPGFTFASKPGTAQFAMSMTEDDRGIVWAALNPSCGVVSFDPSTRTLRDYGSVYRQNWSQYPRYIATDDAGYVYLGDGITRSQIIALDPASGKATAILPENERKHGVGYVYRGLDGKVYGQALAARGEKWYELYRGQAKKIGEHKAVRPKKYIAGSQGLSQPVFPDGSRYSGCDLIHRRLVITDAHGIRVRDLHFDYASEGAAISAVALAPDGTICGGTNYPFRFFSYNPKTGKTISRDAMNQWNAVAKQGDQFFIAAYSGGYLMHWNPAALWSDTSPNNPQSNPRILVRAEPTVNRPAVLFPYSDGQTLVMGGTPGYGDTGGGLLFWDRARRQSQILTDEQLIPNESTSSLVALPDGMLVGGTTTSPGTGGEIKATTAELYTLDFRTKKILWHAPLIPGAKYYADLRLGPRNLVYGITDDIRFFVFDPAEKAIIHQQVFAPTLGPAVAQQGPRLFIADDAGSTYLLLRGGIVLVDPKDFRLTLVAKMPQRCDAGGDYFDKRIYLGCGSHLFSYTLK